MDAEIPGNATGAVPSSEHEVFESQFGPLFART